MVERERRFPNSCSLHSQEKNNAGFGRNEGTLVVLAEPPTQGKVALCSVVAAAGVLSERALGETRHTKGQLLLLMRTPQEVTKDSWSSFQVTCLFLVPAWKS